MTNIANWQVLVVEDEPDSMNIMQKLFSYFGAKVLVVPSAEEALNILETMQPTLVILDLLLPNMDGWDLLQVVRSHPVIANTPVVSVTAYYSHNVARHAKEAGFDACFPKPLMVFCFLEELKLLIETYQPKRIL
jgi:CheY-like chemotaxis protein